MLQIRFKSEIDLNTKKFAIKLLYKFLYYFSLILIKPIKEIILNKIIGKKQTNKWVFCLSTQIY